MIKIIRTEWLKIKGYKAFWGVLAMTALTYPGINYMFWYEYTQMIAKEKSTGQMARMLLGNPFTFPEIFHTSAFLSSIFVFIPAILVIMLITNEYTYKTSRQNIIDGWSRRNFLTGKLIDVLIVTLMVTIILGITSFAVGSIATKEVVSNPIKEWWYIALFALQTFAQLSLAFLVGFLVRRAFIALSIFVFYFLIVENMAVAILKIRANDIGRFLPLEVADRMIPNAAFIGKFNPDAYEKSLADIQPHILYTCILITLIWGFCFWINNRRDL